MSSWVAPAVAAEYWGVSIEHVHWLIRENRCAVRTEGHLLMVDVAPDCGEISQPRLKPSERPATFTLVSPEEIAALQADPEPQWPETESAATDEEDETRGAEVAQYRWIRQQVALTRKRPAVI